MLYTTQNLSSLKTSPMHIFHKVRNLNWGSHNFKMRLSITKVMQLQKKKQSRKHLTLPALILFRSQCPIPVLTFLVLIGQKSFRYELLAICTDCRKIIIQQRHFPKKDWLYPEETKQHVLPQRCVLVTICLFVCLFVFFISFAGNQNIRQPNTCPFSVFFCLLVLLKMLVLKP